MLTETDALGHGTTYSYDGLGREASQTDADGNTTSYSYDAVGNMLTETDPDGNVTTYTYDSLNRQTSMTDALDNTATYAYDADGNVVQTIDRGGQEIDYSYDHLNRETAELWISGSTAFETISTTYNDAGQVASVTDSGDTRDANPQYVDYAYSYDDIGCLGAVESTGPTGTADVLLSYTYDGDGNCLSLSATVNSTSDFQNSYSYDALNRMVEVVQSGQQGGDSVAYKRADFTYNSGPVRHHRPLRGRRHRGAGRRREHLRL